MSADNTKDISDRHFTPPFTLSRRSFCDTVPLVSCVSAGHALCKPIPRRSVSQTYTLCCLVVGAGILVVVSGLVY